MHVRLTLVRAFIATSTIYKFQTAGLFGMILEAGVSLRVLLAPGGIS